MDADKCKEGSRRKFLKTAGKFAVYTPPALVLMSKPGSNVFANSVNNSTDNGTTDSGTTEPITSTVSSTCDLHVNYAHDVYSANRCKNYGK